MAANLVRRRGSDRLFGSRFAENLALVAGNTGRAGLVRHGIGSSW